MFSMCDSKNKSKCRSKNTQKALSLHLVTLIPRWLLGVGLECALSIPSENPFLVSSPVLPEPDPRARSLWACTKVSATSKAGPESDRSCDSVHLWVLSKIRPDQLWAREGGYWSGCLPLPQCGQRVWVASSHSPHRPPPRSDGLKLRSCVQRRQPRRLLQSPWAPLPLIL